MKLKFLLIPITLLSITFSGTVLAKKPEGKGNPHSGGPDARWENSNRQSDEYSLRGQERAEERHRLKEPKKHKQKNYKKEKKLKHKKEKYHDRYEQRRDDERYNKKHEKKDRRYKDEYYDDDRYQRKRDRYEQQRYEERYRNNPFDAVIDRNVKDAKSEIDKAQRKAIESIDNKSRELTGTETRRDRTKRDKPWWSIFGD